MENTENLEKALSQTNEVWTLPFWLCIGGGGALRFKSTVFRQFV
jgi:hypothetical protein